MRTSRLNQSRKARKTLDLGRLRLKSSFAQGREVCPLGGGRGRACRRRARRLIVLKVKVEENDDARMFSTDDIVER